MAGDAAGVWEGVSAPGQEGGQPDGLEGEKVWAEPTLTSLPLDWDPGGHGDTLGEGRVGSTGLGGAGLCGEWRRTRFRASLGRLLNKIRAK